MERTHHCYHSYLFLLSAGAVPAVPMLTVSQRLPTKFLHADCFCTVEGFIRQRADSFADVYLHRVLETVVHFVVASTDGVSHLLQGCLDLCRSRRIAEDGLCCLAIFCIQRAASEQEPFKFFTHRFQRSGQLCGGSSPTVSL